MTTTETIESVADLEAQRWALTERIARRKAVQQRREWIAEGYRELGASCGGTPGHKV